MKYTKLRGTAIGVGMLLFFVLQFAYGTLLTFTVGLPIAILIMVTMQLVMICPKCNSMVYDATNDPNVESISTSIGFFARVLLIPVKCNSCGMEF